MSKTDEELAISKIISSVQAAKSWAEDVLKPRDRVSFVVSGKPGSGKSILAEKIASQLFLHLIQPKACVERAFNDPSHPQHLWIRETLLGGREIDTIKMLELLKLDLNSESAKFKGFVIDGFPLLRTSPIASSKPPTAFVTSKPLTDTVGEKALISDSHSTTPVTESLSSPKPFTAQKSMSKPMTAASAVSGTSVHPDTGLAFIQDILKNGSTSTANPVFLIDLSISDEDCIRRLNAQFLDPVTQLSYSAAQIQFSRKKITEGYVEGHEKEGDVDGSEEDVGDTEDDSDSEDDDSEDGSTKKKSKLVIAPPKPIHNVVNWKVLSLEIIDRLLKSPEDAHAFAAADLHTYSLNNTNSLLYSSSGDRNIIVLDATRPDDMVYENFIYQLKKRNQYSRFPIVMPKHLNPLNTGFQPTSDADALQYYSSLSLEKGMPKREMSHFQKMCPVTFADGGKQIEGDWNRVVLYKGYLFFPSTDEYMARFMENPDRFLSNGSPKTPPFSIAISGPALSGCSSQAKIISQLYNLKLISPEAIINVWIKDPETRKGNKTADLVVSRLLRGQTVPTDSLMEIIKQAISDCEKSEKKGWVLDGFPRGAEDAQAMVTAEIQPQYAMVFQVDPKDKSYRDRVQKLSIHPYNISVGSSIKPYLFHSEAVSAFTNELTDLFKGLKDLDSKLINLPTNLDITTTLSAIINMVDPFLPKTRLIGQDEEVGEAGYTKDYCPVTLLRRRVLQKGSGRMQVAYNSKIYQLADEDRKDAFLQDPFTYGIKVMPDQIPPPRIAFIGPNGSGKTTILNSLNYPDIPKLDMPKYVKECANRAHGKQRQTLNDSYTAESGFNQSSIMQEVIQTLYDSTDLPYRNRGFLMEGFPRSAVEMDFLQSQYPVDAVVLVQIDPEIALKRLQRAQENARIASGEAWDLDPDQEEELTEQLLERCNKENALFNDMTIALENSHIPFLEVDGTKSVRYNLSKILPFLRPFLNLRSNIFHDVKAIDSTEHMKNLLNSGIAKLGPYGTQCPVSYSNHTRFWDGVPYWHKGLVYQVYPEFIDEFIANAGAYDTLPTPREAFQPTICLVGPPKTGKRSLGFKLGEALRLDVLTVEKIVQFILDGQESTALHYKIKSELTRGNILPQVLLAEAIVIVTNRLKESGRGWILVDFPDTMSQVQDLQTAGWKVNAVFQFDELKQDELLARAASTFKEDISAGRTSFSFADILTAQTETVVTNLKEMKPFFTENFGNWETLNGTKSRWALREEVVMSVKDLTLRHEIYEDLKAHGKAAAIYRVGLGPKIVSASYGRFSHYCPVQFVDYSQLHPGDKNSTVFVAEYRDAFYSLSNELNLAVFLANPERYVDGPLFPDDLPQTLSATQVKDSFPLVMELQGYCPVTFAQIGKGVSGFDGIVLGSTDFAARYKGKIYIMASAIQLDRFMRTPWDFENLTLPKKLPPPAVNIPLSTLPQIGYLEQTVAALLTKALTEVGRNKPKFPYKTLEASAVEYLALYLKANNAKAKDWVRKTYKQRLEKYHGQCNLLRSVCSILEQEKYDPVQGKVARSLELESQMNSFIGYKPAPSRESATALSESAKKKLFEKK